MTLYSVLSWSTYEGIITLILLGYDTLCTPGFGDFLLFFSADPLKLCQVRWGPAIFRCLQRCSIGFKSGLWLGHSGTFTELSLSHSCVALDVCITTHSSTSNYVQSIEFSTGGLQSRCRNISRMIKRNGRHLSSIWSDTANSLNVYVNVIFQFFLNIPFFQ